MARRGQAVIHPRSTRQIYGANTLSNECRSNKEGMKKPGMTAQEKKTAKKSKKESRAFPDTDGSR